MRKLTMILGSALLMAALFGACTLPATMPTETEAMAEDTMAEDAMAEDATAEDATAEDTMAEDTMAEDATAEDTMAEDTMAEDATAMPDMDLPAWQTLPLVDVRTGESFTLADYAGKALFVEPMATWCPNCRSQLGTVKTAVANADPEQVAFLALSVEAGLDASTLAAYADQNEFGWRFAVAPPEMLQALAETFGPTVANPPATPHFIVRPDGSYTDLTTGFTASETILADLASAVAGQ